MNFVINTGSPTPIYQQIVDQARHAVAAGQLSVGDPLPSVRALADDLLINPNTVARAYATLTREGLIEARAGRGVFIATKRRVYSREEADRRLEALLENVIGEAMTLDFTPDELRAAFAKKISQWKHPQTPPSDHD